MRPDVLAPAGFLATFRRPFPNADVRGIQRFLLRPCLAESRLIPRGASSRKMLAWRDAAPRFFLQCQDVLGAWKARAWASALALATRTKARAVSADAFACSS